MSASGNTRLPVFVINLDADRERLILMEKTLGSLGIVWERIAGVDGNTLSRETRSRLNRRVRLRKLTPGEMGCLESHVHIWQRIAEGPQTAALVLEDDVHLAPDVALLARDAGWLPGDDCIVRLEASPMRVVLGPQEKEVYGRGLYRLRSFQYGSGAYVITQSRARALLAAYRECVDQADAFMFRFPKTNHVYQLLPGVCIQKVWQVGQRSGQNDRAAGRIEGQRTAADRRSWFDPPAALRRLTWKTGSIATIAWDVIRGYSYQMPRFRDSVNDS